MDSILHDVQAATMGTSMVQVLLLLLVLPAQVQPYQHLHEAPRWVQHKYHVISSLVQQFCLFQLMLQDW